MAFVEKGVSKISLQVSLQQCSQEGDVRRLVWFGKDLDEGDNDSEDQCRKKPTAC